MPLSLKEKLLVYNYSDIVREQLTAIPWKPGIIAGGGGRGNQHFQVGGEGGVCDQLMSDEDFATILEREVIKHMRRRRR